jgi:hypothetical protein
MFHLMFASSACTMSTSPHFLWAVWFKVMCVLALHVPPLDVSHDIMERNEQTLIYLLLLQSSRKPIYYFLLATCVPLRPLTSHPCNPLNFLYHLSQWHYITSSSLPFEVSWQLRWGTWLREIVEDHERSPWIYTIERSTCIARLVRSSHSFTCVFLSYAYMNLVIRLDAFTSMHAT